MLAATLALLVSAVGTLALAAQTAAPTNELAPYISGGGAAAAVGGLVYIARLMANGRLVARDPAVEAEALKGLLDRVLKVEEVGGERERSYHALLVDQLRKGGFS